MRKTFLVFLLCFALTSTTQAAEKVIGSTCSSDNSAADWDSIAHCSNGTMVKAPLILGAPSTSTYTTTTCDSTKAGMLQWTGTSFQGCNGTSWGSLGSGSSGSSGSTIIMNWPDAIVCKYGSLQAVLFPLMLPSGDSNYYYGDYTYGYIAYNSSGQYAINSGFGNFDCVTSAYTITQLYTNSRAFNLVGGESGSEYLGTSSTVTSPSRSDDVTTGLFSDTASTVSIATGGTERLRVTGTGNIGIGTATPVATLDVNGPIKLGTSSITCSSTYAGLLRYTASNTLEYCTGTSWAGFGGNTIQMATNASAPSVCSSSNNGEFALTSRYTTCACRGGVGWVSTSDGSTGCNWATPTMISQSTGTTIGNMTAGGGINAAFDGNTNQGYTAGAYNATAGAMGYVGKDWGSDVSIVIQRVVVFGSNDNGYTLSGNTVSLTIQGSNDNSTWTTLLSTTFTCGSSTDSRSYDSSSGLITTAQYRYHRVTIQDQSGQYYAKLAEVQFYQ